MKKLIFNLMIIALSIVILQSCKKDVIINEYGVDYALNKYILTNMEAEIFSGNDTCEYSDVEIKLNFKGLLVGEDTEYSVSLGNNIIMETPYFINVIKDIKAYCNNPSYKCYFYIYTPQNNTYQRLIGTIGEELGYSPRSLFLSGPPDTSDYYSFTIEITDIYNNKFVAATDSVYITK